MPHCFLPIGSVLQEVVHRHGLTTRLFEHQLPQRWADIAGAAIAAQTRPDVIRFRKLYLVVGNSMWLQQLVFLKPTLIEKVNEAVGSHVITDIVLRIGDVANPVRPEPAERVDGVGANGVPAYSVGGSLPSTVSTPDRHVPTVKDDSLRERLAALIASAPSFTHPGRVL